MYKCATFELICIDGLLKKNDFLLYKGICMTRQIHKNSAKNSITVDKLGNRQLYLVFEP